ncbi:hypothetical protein JOE61_000928 [Nocardioides salarius]|uniref:Restriction endonuclease n=1 Tax=Nocardioides salarius TaxID=374513 RepID=A0ABS2M7F3_9ACTN|nr:hypothetical protein [Nocardioides salarius]MBM7507114.1 hypothetical protein [Nocardioides salarius]
MPEPRKATVRQECFLPHPGYPHSLRRLDFEAAMQDVCDYFNDVNSYLMGKGFRRLDDMIRPAGLSGMISDMLTDSLGQHARALTPNLQHNGHPDLLVRDRYPGDAAASGEDGVEVKASRKSGGAVDTHGARKQVLCVFTYEVDNRSWIAAQDREPFTFREVYINEVETGDFRLNNRGELGTRTATLHKDGLKKWRQDPVYLDMPFNENTEPWRSPTGKMPKKGSTKKTTKPGDADEQPTLDGH